MFYYYDTNYFLYALITLTITMFAHFRVKFMFNKYSKIKCRKSITGLQSSENVLYQNNINGVEICHIHGQYNDYYDPRNNKISLSDPIYNEASIAAVGIASHEAGHAVQYAKNYGFVKARQRLVPITQLCSSLSTPIICLGLMLPVQYNFIVNFGILLFSFAVLFQLVTLPVEFDASKRALVALQNSGNLTDEEMKGTKKVLSAAAMTYVAALFTSLISLIRLVLISSHRNDD
ncbi:MAG: zinc metallopeptidase [Candidatus Paraimprobicoccus trichonymphae]|uniref:Zinc metallopeptidase n=1 Tax=Candidatus Paraimprobicoccus trichonymphae TaxID=3033793 RepID=A0AA48HXC5_9FIRM|nr:MAG: zinc metallopeptidase [Candidatus Paraimprobicoccus trichonymphae]